MADQVLIADSGVPSCLTELDPSLTRGANFGQQLGVTDAYANVKWFGAVGDGVTNDSPAIRLAVDYALTNSRVLYFPEGTYGIAGADATYPTASIYINSPDGIEVVADMKATIKPLSSYGLAGSSKVIRIEGGNNGQGKVSWTGGRFDMSNLPGDDTGADALSIGPKFQDVQITGVTFDHGLTTPVGSEFGRGGGDSGLYIKESEHLSVTDCVFLGSYDLGIYISSDVNTGRMGRNGAISNCLFYRCGGGISTKRGFDNLSITGNQFVECGNGFFAGIADSNPLTGDHISITGNQFIRIQGNPIRLTNASKATITGNQILDYRRHVSDGVTATGVAAGNIGGGVLIEGSSGNVVTGNVIGFKDWAPNTDGSRFTPAISIRDFNVTGEHSHNNVVVGNMLINAESGFFISNSSTNNLITPNNVVDCLSNDRLGTDDTNRHLNLAGDNGTGFKWLTDNIFSAVSNNGEVARFNAAGGGGNYLSFVSNTSGSPPQIMARGVDSIIDLHLLPRGSSGFIKYGKYTASPGAVTGHIQIKDDSGVVRKLAVIA